MSTKLVLPKWGMGIEEGTLLRWLKSEGDVVRKGEPIAEIETAKATQELEAPVGGVLVRLLLAEGQSAPVNTEIAIIDETHQ